MSNLKLQILLGAVDKLTAPLKAVSGQSKITAKDLAAAKAKVRDLEKQSAKIDGFKQLGAQLGITSNNLKAAEDHFEQLKRTIAATANPTRMMVNEYNKAERAVKELSAKQKEMKSRCDGVKLSLQTVTIGTKDLTKTQERLKAATSSANEKLKQQQDQLAKTAAQQKKLAAVKASYDKTMNARGALAGYGAAGAAMGGAALYKGWGVAGKAMGFEQEMSKVQALTRLQSGSADLAGLTAQARELGAKTAYTAGEAAQGQGFLAMAGFSPKAIRDAMPGVLDLAKAGGVEIAQASDIGSNILTGFKLPADQMGRLGDVMVGTFTRANVDLAMLGDTMKYVAPVAAGLGVDLETASAMAGKLGDAGIQGSMGGTAMRAILSRMAAPPKQAADALEELNIKTTDAKGNLRQLPAILEEIYKKTSKMGDAKRAGLLKAIAGEEAFSALAVLSEQAGSGKLQELIKTLRGAQGEAANVAGTMANNALGDIDNLSSAWDDVGIQMLQTERGPLRQLIQSLTSMVQGVGDWMRANPELSSTLVRVSAAIAAAAFVGGSLMVVIAGLIGPFAMLRMGISYMTIAAGPLGTVLKMLAGGFVRLGIAMLTTPVGWIIMAIAAIAAAAYAVYSNWDKIGPALAAVWEQCKAPLGAFWDLLKELFSWTPIGMLITHWNDIWAFFDTLPAGAMAKGKAIIQGLIDGISAKWASLMEKIKAVTDYLPNWMKGGSDVKITTATPAYAGGGGLAAPGASGYGAAFYQPKPLARAAGGGSTVVNAPINITQQPGQSSQDLAAEIDKRLQQRERSAAARQRASLRDTN